MEIILDCDYYLKEKGKKKVLKSGTKVDFPDKDAKFLLSINNAHLPPEEVVEEVGEDEDDNKGKGKKE